MAPRDRAQQGVDLIKQAVLDLLAASDSAMTHAQIVNELGIHSDFEGAGRNYLSWSILGMLVNAGQVRYKGERQDRRYYVRDDQLNPAR